MKNKADLEDIYYHLDTSSDSRVREAVACLIDDGITATPQRTAKKLRDELGMSEGEAAERIFKAVLYGEVQIDRWGNFRIFPAVLNRIRARFAYLTGSKKYLPFLEALADNVAGWKAKTSEGHPEGPLLIDIGLRSFRRYAGRLPDSGELVEQLCLQYRTLSVEEATRLVHAALFDGTLKAVVTTQTIDHGPAQEWLEMRQTHGLIPFGEDESEAWEMGRMP